MRNGNFVLSMEDLDLISQARRSADEILNQYYCIPICKALNVGTPSGFDRAIAALASEIRAAAAPLDTEAVRAAIGVLDIDWQQSTASQRRVLISQALNAAGRKTSAVPTTVEAVFGDAADKVVNSSRSAIRRSQKLAIGADFNMLDRRIIDHLKVSQANFIRDEYGRRSQRFSERARRIVARDLEAGLGRDDIAADLQTAAQTTLGGQGSFYWDVVAGSFVGRGRSFTQLSAFAEAGIGRYVIEAVLDEATTEICRFMHGKIFSVDRGIKLFEQVEAQPDDIKDLNPWIRKGVDDQGSPVLYVNSDKSRSIVAEITRSGVGRRDDQGSFSRGLSERELMDLGVGQPPYHGL